MTEPNRGRGANPRGRGNKRGTNNRDHDQSHQKSDHSESGRGRGKSPFKPRGGHSDKSADESTRGRKSPYKPRGGAQKDKTDRSDNSNAAGRQSKKNNNNNNNNNNNSNNRNNNRKDEKSSKKSKNTFKFEPYLSKEEVDKGLQEKTLYSGVIRINANIMNDCYVTVEGFDADIRVNGRESRNRAFHGDTVVIALIDKPDFRRGRKSKDGKDKKKDTKKNENKEKEEHNEEHDEEEEDEKEEEHEQEEDDEDDILKEEDDEEDLGEEILLFKEPIDGEADLEDTKEERKFAKVVYILEANHPTKFIGAVKKQTNHYLFVPSDNKLPWMFVARKPKSLLIGEDHKTIEQLLDAETNFFLAELLDWEETRISPRAALITNFGKKDHTSTQFSALKLANDIRHTEDFSPAVFDHLPMLRDATWHIPPQELATRWDLRKKMIFSIDPPTAKDLDDALSCELLDNGNFLIGVHIADVSHFVPLNSNLDKEARDRATTVYLVNENIPMLPRILCDKLCSLQANEDRLAFSVEWEMTPEAEIISERFGKSVIRTCAQLDYKTAHNMIASPVPEGDLPANVTLSLYQEMAKAVFHLNTLAVLMKEKRFAGGSVSLDSPEIDFTFDDKGNIIGVKPYIRYDSHFLVEEWMLFANIAVAKKIHSGSEGAVLRRHAAPQDRKITALIDNCKKHLQFEIDATTSQTFHESMQTIKDTHGEEIMNAILFTSRPMQAAEYCCTLKDRDLEFYHHYALNFPLYCHFTSPIRRYPDLIVHHQLAAVLEGRPFSLPTRTLEQICANCNERKMNADHAQRQCDQLFLNEFLRKSSMPANGIVVAIANAGVNVYVPDFDAFKTVRYANFKDEFTVKYDKEKETVVLNWKASGDLPAVRMSLSALDRVPVEMYHTEENFLRVVGIRFIRPVATPDNIVSGNAASTSDTPNKKKNRNRKKNDKKGEDKKVDNKTSKKDKSEH